MNDKGFWILMGFLMGIAIASVLLLMVDQAPTWVEYRACMDDIDPLTYHMLYGGEGPCVRP